MIGGSIGMLAGIASPTLLEIAAGAGFGTIVLDGEHGFPLGDELVTARRACHAGGARCLLRVGLNQLHHVATACDGGLDGIVVSNASDFDELEDVARLMLPTPLGRRSINPFTEATRRTGDVGSFMESAEALDLWAMAETTGIVDSLTASSGELPPVCRHLLSTVVIGPYDLSAAFGEVCSPSNAALTTIMRRIEAGAREAGLTVALFARDCDLLEGWLAAGLRPEVALVGYDRDIWSTSCSARLETSRRLLSAASPAESARSSLSPPNIEETGA